MLFPFKGPYEVAKMVAHKARAKRLSHNYSQKTVAQKAGMSLSTLKLFEQTGKISLNNLLKIALVLDSLEQFQELFPQKPESITTLDQLLKEEPQRQRGRT